MLKMRKLLSIALVVGICTSVSVNALAQSNSDSVNEQKYAQAKAYFSQIQVDQDEIAQMINEHGFSYSDAVYYYTLDKMVDYLTKTEMSFNLSENATYSDQEIAEDLNGFKDKILDFDVNAIATAVRNSQETVKKLPLELERLRAHYGSNDSSKITIKNSDGSVVEFTTSTEKVAEPTIRDSRGKLNVSARKAPQESVWHHETFPKYGTYNGTSEVKFTAPNAYTQLFLQTNTTYDSSGVNVNSVDCSTATYGTITVSNKSNYAHNYDNTHAEGVGDVVWASSCSFGTSFTAAGTVGLSFSVNAGASWTERLIHRYTDKGDWYRVTEIYA